MEIKELKSTITNSTSPYFTRNNLKSLMEPGISRRTLDYRIQALIQEKSLLLLKQGFYLNLNAYQLATDKQSFIQFVATKLVYPSYVSLEYALAQYGFLAESIYSLTLITTKKTTKFTNSLFATTYKNLKPELYTGYTQKSFGNLVYNYATLSKALFDYIYLTPMANQNEIKLFLTQSRFNYAVLNLDEQTKLKNLIDQTNSSKLQSALQIILKECQQCI